MDGYRGYARVSKADGSQVYDLQRDALTAAGVKPEHIYEDAASGRRDEFERALIVKRTRAGLAAARARGRNGRRPFKMTPAKLRLTTAAIGQPETKVGDLCAELGIT